MTIFGWDMSHYDDPDPRSAVAEGYVFLTHKAGGDGNDLELAAWWAKVKDYGPEALLGAYWVLYPGTPASRADAFLARLDAVCPGWRQRDGFILQVDCEKWSNDPGTMPGVADIKAFCDRLTDRTDLVYRPVVYAPEWTYGERLKGLGYPLWASSYVPGAGTGSALYAKAGGDDSPRWAAYSARIPVILQFSSSATVAGQATCDVNAYRGTLAQLKELVSPGKVVPDVNLKDSINDSAYASRTLQTYIKDTQQLRDMLVGDSKAPPAPPRLAALLALPGQVAALGNSLTAAIKALAALDPVDEVALGKSLAEGVAAAVLASLPSDRDDISQDEVTAAVEAAFRGAFGTTSA